MTAAVAASETNKMVQATGSVMFPRLMSSTQGMGGRAKEYRDTRCRRIAHQPWRQVLARYRKRLARKNKSVGCVIDDHQ